MVSHKGVWRGNFAVALLCPTPVLLLSSTMKPGPLSSEPCSAFYTHLLPSCSRRSSWWTMPALQVLYALQSQRTPVTTHSNIHTQNIKEQKRLRAEWWEERGDQSWLSVLLLASNKSRGKKKPVNCCDIKTPVKRVQIKVYCSMAEAPLESWVFKEVLFWRK